VGNNVIYWVCLGAVEAFVGEGSFCLVGVFIPVDIDRAEVVIFGQLSLLNDRRRTVTRRISERHLALMSLSYSFHNVTINLPHM